MRQAHTVHIRAPIDDVFEYTEDPDNAPEWAEGIVGFELLDEAENNVGTTYEMHIEEGGRVNTYQGEVVAWEENRHTSNRVERDGMAMIMDRDYAAVGDGTEVTMTVRVELAGWTKVMAPLIWLMNRHFLKKQASKLKELIEAQRAGI